MIDTKAKNTSIPVERVLKLRMAVSRLSKILNDNSRSESHPNPTFRALPLRSTRTSQGSDRAISMWQSPSNLVKGSGSSKTPILSEGSSSSQSTNRVYYILGCGCPTVRIRIDNPYDNLVFNYRTGDEFQILDAEDRVLEKIGTSGPTLIVSEGRDYRLINRDME